MHELIYYSIFAIILYFVLSSVFETFSVEQENFDPSLVPVSSIVTLAKVAQKLVNGNGTLTNPGNLQIGASASAPGNLTVTGNINIAAASGNNGINITSGNPYIAFNKTGANGGPQIYSDGNILHAYNAPFQVDQTLIVGVDQWHKSVDGKNRVKYGNNSRSYYGSGDGSHEFKTGTDAGFSAMILNSAANLSLFGGITTGGGVDGIPANTNNGHLTVNGGINISGFNGTVSVPEVNGNAGETVQKGLNVGNLTLGKFNNDPTYDVIRSGAPAGLLLSSTSKNIYVWGKNNLRCQNELTVDGKVEIKSGQLQVNGSLNTNDKNLNVDNGLIVNGAWGGLGTNAGQNMSSRIKLGSLNIGYLPHAPQHNIITSNSGGNLLINSDREVEIWVSDFRSNNININEGKQLCINKTCINEDHLRMLKGEKPFGLRRTPDDNNNNAWFKGDNQLWVGRHDGYTSWKMHMF